MGWIKLVIVRIKVFSSSDSGASLPPLIRFDPRLPARIWREIQRNTKGRKRPEGDGYRFHSTPIEEKLPPKLRSNRGRMGLLPMLALM
jgi:hypothetical protein